MHFQTNSTAYSAAAFPRAGPGPVCCSFTRLYDESNRSPNFEPIAAPVPGTIAESNTYPNSKSIAESVPGTVADAKRSPNYFKPIFRPICKPLGHAIYNPHP